MDADCCRSWSLRYLPGTAPLGYPRQHTLSIVRFSGGRTTRRHTGTEPDSANRHWLKTARTQCYQTRATNPVSIKYSVHQILITEIWKIRTEVNCSETHPACQKQENKVKYKLEPKQILSWKVTEIWDGPGANGPNPYVLQYPVFDLMPFISDFKHLLLLFSLENDFALFCILQRFISLTENVLCSCSPFQKMKMNLLYFACLTAFFPLQKTVCKLYSACYTSLLFFIEDLCEFVFTFHFTLHYFFQQISVWNQFTLHLSSTENLNKFVSLCILHCIFSPTEKCVKSVYIACYPALFFPQNVFYLFLAYVFIPMFVLQSAAPFINGKSLASLLPALLQSTPLILPFLW